MKNIILFILIGLTFSMQAMEPDNNQSNSMKIENFLNSEQQKEEFEQAIFILGTLAKIQQPQPDKQFIEVNIAQKNRLRKNIKFQIPISESTITIYTGFKKPNLQMESAKTKALEKYWNNFEQILLKNGKNPLLWELTKYKENQISNCPLCEHSSNTSSKTRNMRHLITHVEFICEKSMNKEARSHMEDIFTFTDKEIDITTKNLNKNIHIITVKVPCGKIKMLSNESIELTRAKYKALENFWSYFEKALQEHHYELELINNYKENNIQQCPLCNKTMKNSSQSRNLRHLVSHIQFVENHEYAPINSAHISRDI